MRIVDRKENILKIVLWISIALDILLYACFFFGFTFSLGGAKLGFLMLGIAFRYGISISVTSILAKLIVIVTSFRQDTDAKRKMFPIALFFMVLLIIIGGAMWGIYYIGKVMSQVG